MSHNTLGIGTRPTFTRKVSDDNRAERAVLPTIRTPSPTGEGPYGVVMDTFDRSTSRPPSVAASSFRDDRSLLETRRPSQIPEVPGNLLARTQSRFARVLPHWRELTVGSALMALGSWAIWATVKIKEYDHPYCVFDDQE